MKDFNGERMKKFLPALMLAVLVPLCADAAKYEPIPTQVKKPAKYTQDYIDEISAVYKKTGDNQLFFVALDMLKGTTGEFSRNAILGDNLTGKPVKIEFKDLTEINPEYGSFDAVGWKRKSTLYIYINPKHKNAPPAALAALLAHEALHQDEFNSLSEETYAWTMEATVWYEMLQKYPELETLDEPLVRRENILKQLFEKGNYSNKYIKKNVYANKGYKGLPISSPGFESL